MLNPYYNSNKENYKKNNYIFGFFSFMMIKVRGKISIFEMSIVINQAKLATTF